MSGYKKTQTSLFTAQLGSSASP